MKKWRIRVFAYSRVRMFGLQHSNTPTLQYSNAFSILCLLLSAVCCLSPVWAAPTVKDVAASLVCKCGCGNMMISVCECANAQTYRAIIAQQIKAGMSKEEILDALVKMTASEKMKELAERANAIEAAAHGSPMTQQEFDAIQKDLMEGFQDLVKQAGASEVPDVKMGDVSYFIKNCGRGEEILGAPKAKGVHLIGWTLPFILLLIGAGVVYTFLQRLQKKPPSEPLSAKPPDAGAPPAVRAAESKDKDYEARLDEELKEFEF